MTKPVVVGNSTLYLSDCREILSTLPIGGAVITDPPYGIGFKYEGRADDGADLDDALRLIKRRGFPLGPLMYPEEMMAQVVPVMGKTIYEAWALGLSLKDTRYPQYP